jgi:hypothetical protein
MDPVTSQGAEVVLRLLQAFVHIVAISCLLICVFLISYQMTGG